MPSNGPPASSFGDARRGFIPGESRPAPRSIPVAEHFEIQVIWDRGEAMGEIVIGEFREMFALDLQVWTSDDYVGQWRSALDSLVRADGARVALMSWACPPQLDCVRRAWRMHRYGDVVRIQENLYVPGAVEFTVTDQGDVVDDSDMRLTTDDGDPVSEWRCTLRAIAAFRGMG